MGGSVMDELPACTISHHTPSGTAGVEFGDNQDRDCLSIWQTDPANADMDAIIHICDWPAFKAAGDKHQQERGGKV
jgi:hypothetical protein